MKDEITTIYVAGAVRDAEQIDFRPGAIAVRGGKVMRVGSPQDVLHHYRKAVQASAADETSNAADPRRKPLGRPHLPDRGPVQVIEMPDHLLLPAFVNAHAHLALTNLGSWPDAGTGDDPGDGSGDGSRRHSARFTDWLLRVIREAPRDEQAIAAAVKRGVALSRAAGVGQLGDIAPTLGAIEARSETKLPGVSYLECFGIGNRQQQAIEELDELVKSPGIDPVDDDGIAVGLQPHAPYSVGRDLYRAVTRISTQRTMRISTHLAETEAEIDFVSDAVGPFVSLLRELGKWDDSIVGNDQHPIDWLETELKHGRWLLAHCNYVEDQHIDLLAKTHASVVYCPIASEYFGHVNHRYRDMLAAGVNVCLGTDSVMCQPVDEKQPLGILPQMRRLFHRDGTDAQLLLKMGTINGSQALLQRGTHASLAKGTAADIVAVKFDAADSEDPLVQVLKSNEPVEPICGAVV